MAENFRIALKQCELNKGLTKSDVNLLMDKLNSDEVYVLDIQSEEVASAAIGFITTDLAEELSYEYDGLIEFVRSILDDTEKENDSGCYIYSGINIWLNY